MLPGVSCSSDPNTTTTTSTSLGQKVPHGAPSTQLILGPSSGEEEEVVEAAASEYPCARLFSELGSAEILEPTEPMAETMVT